MTTTDEKLLHPPEEAAKLLTVSRSQMFELIASGQIESVKIGRLRRIPHDALTAYIDRLRANSPGPVLRT
jgi:excisionase family DNA binding protein